MSQKNPPKKKNKQPMSKGKTWKDLQNTWRSITRDHFMTITRKPDLLETKDKEMRGDLRLLHKGNITIPVMIIITDI